MGAGTLGSGGQMTPRDPQKFTWGSNMVFWWYNAPLDRTRQTDIQTDGGTDGHDA